jgi:molybdopterin synthase sulfur carrier subunit
MSTEQPRDGRGASPPSEASSQDEDTSGPSVDLVFWAGAKAVAGTASESWRVASVGAALRAAAERRRDPGFDRLLTVCTVLVDGVVVHPDRLDAPLDAPVRAEILPPFAGGAARRCVNER